MSFEDWNSRADVHENQHNTASAFQSEYMQLAQAGTPAREVQKPEAKEDQKSAAQEKPTASEQAATAFEKFAKTKQLTPELNKQFQDAITAADKGPSPKIPGLEKEVKDRQAELDKVFPQTARDEVKKLAGEMEKEYGALPKDKQAQVGMLMQFRGMVGDADRAKIDEELKKVAPGIVDKMDKIEKLQAPAIPVVEKLQEASQSLAMEKDQAVVTRMMYGVALAQSGDREGAKKQISDAALKSPELLNSEEFGQIAQALGIDVEALKKQQKK